MGNIVAIAKESGVSPATVSRVLRNPTQLRTENQQRIVEVAKRLGYRFSREQTAGISGKNRQILFLCFENVLSSNAMRDMYPLILEGANSVLAPLGFNLLVASVKDDNIPPPSLLRSEVDGVLFHGNVTPDFYREHLEKIPCVGLQHYDPRWDCSWVKVDNINLIFQAVRHLHELGHRRIALLFSSNGLIFSKERYRGYREALDFFGLEHRTEWDIDVPSSRPYEVASPDYRPLIEPVFRSKKRPTALICVDNFRAQKAMEALMRIGLEAPGDVSLIGSGNEATLEAETFFTGVCDKFQAICAQAAELLIRTIKGEEKEVVTLQVRPELYIKKSTRKI